MRWGPQGGKVAFQMFDTKASSDTDEDIFDPPPTKKKKTGKRKNSQPLIIAACTPLMARVHQSIRQAEELIFCDSTSSLERYNCCSNIAFPVAIIQLHPHSPPFYEKRYSNRCIRRAGRERFSILFLSVSTGE